jgi:hypothetical protein
MEVQEGALQRLRDSEASVASRWVAGSLLDEMHHWRIAMTGPAPSGRNFKALRRGESRREGPWHSDSGPKG